MKTKQFSKQILSVLLCIAMLMSYVPMTAVAAEGDPVAKVGDTEYTDISEAIDNWTSGTTLTLLADVTAPNFIGISDSRTIDLNGHSYMYSNSIFGIKSGGTLTIKDSSDEENGAVSYTYNKVNSRPIDIHAGGTLILEGGRITTDNSGNPAVYCYSNGSTLTMTGGTIENTAAYDAVTVSYGSTAEISGGTIKSGSIGIGYLKGGTLTIGGSTKIEADYSIWYGESCEDVTGKIDLSQAASADGWTIKNGCYGFSLTAGEYLILPEELELQVDTVKVDTLEYGYTATISHPHSGGTATCGAQAICDICSKPYGTTPVHSFDETGKCSGCGQQATISVTDGTNTYYALDAASLNTAVTDLLNTGERTFTVNLPAIAEPKLFTAIRRALIDTEGVEDGSVNLALAGVTAIPDHDEMDPSTAIFGAYFGNEIECVTQLVSISLPDVLTIGDNAFDWCENLVSLTAPKVQTVGDWAFAYTAITELELPEATTLGWGAFDPCEDLISVKLPKAVSLGQQAFDNCNSLTYVELTAVDGITFSNNVFDSTANIDLVLNCSKAGEITDGVTWKGYTFKSITINHIVEYTANNDGTTHKKGCRCGAVLENATEPHTTIEEATCTTKAVCQYCGEYGTEPKGHSTTATDDKAATCAVPAYCSVCQQYYGEKLTHNYTYTANDETDTITESCDQGCGHSATIKIMAPSNAVYDGNEKGVTVTGDIIAEHTLTYNVEGTPVNAGTYTATLAVGGKSVSVEFTIAKANPEYTVPAGLTATYGDTLADVTLPAGWTWKEEGTTSVGNAGTRTFKALYNPDSNNYNTVEAAVTIEVAKADIDFDTLTDPEFAEGLVYNGTAQALVTETGYVEGGTIVYSLSPDGEYTTTIPVATEAGTYVVYWGIKGDENHNDYITPGATYTTVYITDATDPTGEILIKENSWKKFLNWISFGLFCKDNVDVIVTADGTGSAVAKVEYLFSTTALNEDNLPADGWKTIAGNDGTYTFAITAQNKGAVYVKITDAYGNVAVINSDGIVVYADSKAIDTEVHTTYPKQRAIGWG